MNGENRWIFELVGIVFDLNARQIGTVRSNHCVGREGFAKAVL